MAPLSVSTEAGNPRSKRFRGRVEHVVAAYVTRNTRDARHTLEWSSSKFKISTSRHLQRPVGDVGLPALVWEGGLEPHESGLRPLLGSGPSTPADRTRQMVDTEGHRPALGGAKRWSRVRRRSRHRELLADPHDGVLDIVRCPVGRLGAAWTGARVAS